MHSKLLRAYAIGVFAVGLATIAHAQQSGPAAQSVDVGKYEYEAHCAVCHGLSVKGDGIYVSQLKTGTVMLNLTELSKKNNGVFPFARVYEIIDGRVLVKAHGTTDMPIWGREYMLKGTYERNANPNFPEEFARGKVLALTEYIYRLQAK
jgi:mono/diheme cytochrome c family protein